MKKALVTGCSGQDGSILTTYLINEYNYKVDGLVRRLSVPNRKNTTFFEKHKNFRFLEGDVEDSARVNQIINDGQYDEVYLLAAQSFVQYSFNNPVQSALTNYIGVINFVEAIRQHSPHSRVYFACTSEIMGGLNCPETGYTEEGPYHPRSPYGISKLASLWHCKNARDGYGLFVSNGILFNHTGEHRGIEFVSQKIATAAANYYWSCEWGLDYDALQLGNLDARRDLGYARDYVEIMHWMLQQDKADDFVIATGEAHSVREMVESAFKHTGYTKMIRWEGSGIHEVGLDDNDKVVVCVSEKFFRPTDVPILIGDITKAKNQLGWKPSVSFDEIFKRMVENAIDSQH